MIAKFTKLFDWNTFQLVNIFFSICGFLKSVFPAFGFAYFYIHSTLIRLNKFTFKNQKVFFDWNLAL